MINNSKVRLRQKLLSDAANDYAWQRDPELTRLDATSPLAMTFSQYLADYTHLLRYPSTGRYQFAVETIDGRHIGNCAYYNIDEKEGRAELGIMIGDRACWNMGYGNSAVATLVGHIFGKTSLERIWLKTLETNSHAQKCFQKCGFIPCGKMVRDGYNFVLMELHRHQGPEATQPGDVENTRV